MYDYIAGRLVSRRPDRVVLDAGGVGWRILVPLSTYERLPAREGAEAKLLVVHHQREDRQALYGFATEEEREFFELLNSVSGVGPALALSVLSTMPYGEFRAAVLNGDAPALTRVRGVGRKLAARLLLELADAAKRGGPVPGRPVSLAAGAADAALALVALGFDRHEAESRAAEAAKVLGPDAAAGEVVRAVLRGARA
jgi:Holliday junction DNA helicase RuvA